MFPTEDSIEKIIENLQKNTSGVIVLPVNPSVDTVAAATAFYIGLTKIGKNVGVVCSSPIQSQFTGAEKIQDSLSTSGDSLVVSFPYTEGAVDKVDYQIVGDKFNLVIVPKTSQAKLNPKDVKYSYSGGVLEFIVTIDAPNLNSLGAIYKDNPDQFRNKNIINIDRHLVNDYFGSMNYVSKNSSSVSEMIFDILENLQAEIDKDMATNLYAGLLSATNNFTSYSVNAKTFETASSLLKKGAVKRAPQQPPPQSRGGTPFNNQNRAYQAPVSRGTRIDNQTNPIDNVENQPNTKEGTTPNEWLKPKIFKGTGLV